MITCDEQANLITYSQGGLYGSMQSPGSSSGKRLIYCVHGRSSEGCCTVSEGHVEDSPHKDKDPIITYNNTTLSPEHCHRTRNEDVDKKARRKLLIASALCVIFMVCEIVGGVLSGSLAIATDAAHLLTDFASFMISLFSLWVATRPATKQMSFGWYRAEVIGALTSVLMIWVVTAILVYLAVQRIIHEDFEIDAMIMLISSAFGVIVNLVMGLTLHQHGHSHGGGSSHSHAKPKKPKKNAVAPIETSKPVEDVEAHHDHSSRNLNVRAAYIHVIGDFIQSVGVFLAALIIYFKPEWQIVDPICTFLFSILVLLTTYAIIKDTMLVLMEGMPKNNQFVAVMETFLNIEGVIRVHNLRIWALSLDKTVLSAHLVVAAGINPKNVLQEATRLVHDEYDFFEMTLQIEEFQVNMENCNQCQIPCN